MNQPSNAGPPPVDGPSLITVRLTDAACCLLSLDDSGMLKARSLERVKSGRRFTDLRGTPAAIAALREDFTGGSLDGFAAFDNPGACQRTANAAVRAIDAAMAAATARAEAQP